MESALTNGAAHVTNGHGLRSDEGSFLFTSESVGEGHPGELCISFIHLILDRRMLLLLLLIENKFLR